MRKIKHLDFWFSLASSASILFICSTFAATPDAANYALDDSGSWAKPTPASGRLLNALKHWPPATLSLDQGRPEFIRGIRTPGNDDLIGMVKYFVVQVPIEKVVRLNEAFGDYPNIWKDVLSVKIEVQEKNRIVTEWTRKAPAFFLPKVHYRMVTLIDKSNSTRVIYRHQLVDGNLVKTSDALVIADKISDSKTRISVLNFFTPEIGPFRSLVSGKIWRQSLENGFKEDIAFRARIEHPEWSIDRVTEEAEQTLDSFPIKNIEYTDLIHFD